MAGINDYLPPGYYWPPGYCWPRLQDGSATVYLLGNYARIKVMEFNPDSTIKRIEFHDGAVQEYPHDH